MEETNDKNEFSERSSDLFSPVMFICNYYDAIRTEIDSNAESLILYQSKGKKDLNALNDINIYREKIMESLSINEKSSINNCKKNYNEFINRIDFAFSKTDSTAQSLNVIKKDLFLDKSLFFVKIFKVKFPNYFGSLVVVNFFLNEDMISIIKKSLEEFDQLIVLNLFKYYKLSKLRTIKNNPIEERNIEDSYWLDNEVLTILKISNYLFHNVKLNEIIQIDEKNLQNKAQFEKCKLELTFKKIKSIEKNSFQNLIELESLNLSQNKIDIIKANTFDVLINLKVLNLDNNLIDHIEPNAFTGLINLEYITLSSNLIYSFEKRLYIEPRQLKSIDFQNNKISSIIDFKSSLNNNEFKCFKMLNLSNNRLTLIEVNLSSHFDNLEILNLNNNQIRSIRENSFQNLLNLKVLHLTENQISFIQPNIFNGLNKLEKLFLNKNQIELIQSNAFSSLKCLLILNLDNNKLEHIKETTFMGLDSLKQLILSNNKCRQIELNSFKSLKHLNELYLNYNSIPIIETNTFYGLTELKMLSLLKNRLYIIENGSFRTLSNLTSLNLSNNQLKNLNQDLFEGLSSLKNLYLSDNNISFLDEKCFFKHLEALVYLNLARNLITFEDILYDNIPNGIEIDFN